MSSIGRRFQNRGLFGTPPARYRQKQASGSNNRSYRSVYSVTKEDYVSPPVSRYHDDGNEPRWKESRRDSRYTVSSRNSRDDYEDSQSLQRKARKHDVISTRMRDYLERYSDTVPKRKGKSQNQTDRMDDDLNTHSHDGNRDKVSFRDREPRRPCIYSRTESVHRSLSTQRESDREWRMRRQDERGDSDVRPDERLHRRYREKTTRASSSRHYSQQDTFKQRVSRMYECYGEVLKNTGEEAAEFSLEGEFDLLKSGKINMTELVDSCLEKIGSCHSVSNVNSLIRAFIDNGRWPPKRILDMSIRRYFELGDDQQAKKLFDVILPQYRTVHTYSKMIIGYMKKGDSVAAESIWANMPPEARLAGPTSSMVSGYMNLGLQDLAYKFLMTYRSEGVEPELSALAIKVFRKVRRTDLARGLYHNISDESRTVTTENAELRSLMDANQYQEAETFNNNTLPEHQNDRTGTMMITVKSRLGKISEAEAICKSMKKTGFVTSAMIRGYGWNGCLREAKSLYYNPSIYPHDRYTDSAMIDAYFFSKDLDGALGFFWNIPPEQLNQVTQTRMIRVLTDAQRYEDALKVADGIQIEEMQRELKVNVMALNSKVHRLHKVREIRESISAQNRGRQVELVYINSLVDNGRVGLAKEYYFKNLRPEFRTTEIKIKLIAGLGSEGDLETIDLIVATIPPADIKTTLKMVMMEVNGLNERLDCACEWHDRLDEDEKCVESERIMVRSYGVAGRVSKAWKLFCAAIEKYKDRELYSSMLYVFGENGEIPMMERFYETIPKEYIDIAVEDIMIRMFIRNGYPQKAIDWFMKSTVCHGEYMSRLALVEAYVGINEKGKALSVFSFNDSVLTSPVVNLHIEGVLSCTELQSLSERRRSFGVSSVLAKLIIDTNPNVREIIVGRGGKLREFLLKEYEGRIYNHPSDEGKLILMPKY